MRSKEKVSPLQIYLWTLSFTRPYLGLLFALILCTLVIGGIELIIPKIIQHSIDVLFPKKQFRRFIVMMAIITTIIICMIGTMALRNLLERIFREKTARDFQLAMFRHLRKLGFAYYENHPVGDTLSLMSTDLSATQDIYRRYLPGMVWKVLFVLVSVVILLQIHLYLTLIMFASFGLYYLIGPRIEKKASILRKAAREAQTIWHKNAYDSIAALPEIRAYSAESWSIEQFTEKQKARIMGFLRSLMYDYSRDSFRLFINNLGALGIFIYGAYLIRHNLLSIGELTAFILYYFGTLSHMTSLVTDITEQRILLVQAERLFAFSRQIPEVSEPISPIQLSKLHGELHFDHVTFGYPAKPQVLYNFDLRISAGERIALVGSSGHGKSTVLKLIGRFYDPVSGEIRIDGVALKHLSLEQVRDVVGYVFQETFLFGTTIKENIGFGNPDVTDEKIVDAAKAAYAHNFIEQLEHGYDTPVGERGVKLSGGQKQRIAIARLFLKNPKIILLDEATSALDVTSEREVAYALKHLFEGRTTVTVAHRLSSISDYDRIVVVENGTIAEVGTWEELVERKQAFYRLLEGDHEHDSISVK